MKSAHHVSQEELLAHVYGAAPEAAAAHVAECPECAVQFRELSARREGLVALESVPALSANRLIQQRRAVMERLDERAPLRMKWAPALAGACALFAVAVVYTPQHQPAPMKQAVVTQTVATLQEAPVEEQFYDEIYALQGAEEPAAASPIRQLFEPEGQVENR